MPRNALTGTRIRERRIALGVKQADLARRVGISGSYLNLIEHARRRIGGKLLADIARALDVDRSVLAEGAGEALIEALQAAAADASSAVEHERADEFSRRFPGWARLVIEQARQIGSLERVVDGLSDRLTHDPVLAGSLHEMLSAIASIRSTSAILADTPQIEPEWRVRFHRNLHEDSRRLSQTAEALLAHFDRQTRTDTRFSTPLEAVGSFFAAHEHHLPELEDAARGGRRETALDALLASAPELKAPAARALARRYLERYCDDAARLPLASFTRMAEAAAFDPRELLRVAQAEPACVFRRLASLPPRKGRPEIGLVEADGSGTIIFRKSLREFPVPRFGAGCPIWPLYRALARPLLPVQAELEMPGGQRFSSYAICQPLGRADFSAPPVVTATMLLLNAEGEARSQADRVGTSCRICPREGCPARHEPSLLRERF